MDVTHIGKKKPGPSVEKAASELPVTPDPQVLAGRVLAELGIPPGGPLTDRCKDLYHQLERSRSR